MAFRQLTALVALVALVGLVGVSLVAQTSWAAAPAAANEVGPWAIGRTTLAVIDPDRDDRTLTVDVWYPVDPADATGDLSVYDLVFTGIESPAFEDAEPSGAGPFPLIVFSHGSGGLRYQSYFLTEALASHGFVVAAPDHAGNTAFDAIFGGSDPFEVVAVNRPADVSLVITRMLERNADPSDPFAGRVDPERIGVTGHSFGGFTTLAIASGFGPVAADPRVDAILPISPVSTLLTEEELGSIEIPMLVLGGTSDTTTPIDPQSTTAFAEVSARPRYRVDIANAGHNSFTDICPIADALLAAGVPEAVLAFVLNSFDDGCAPELIPFLEAQRITRGYAVSFFKRYVAGDSRYRDELTPGRADAEAVLFQRPGREGR